MNGKIFLLLNLISMWETFNFSTRYTCKKTKISHDASPFYFTCPPRTRIPSVTPIENSSRKKVVEYKVVYFTQLDPVSFLMALFLRLPDYETKWRVSSVFYVIACKLNYIIISLLFILFISVTLYLLTNVFAVW